MHTRKQCKILMVKMLFAGTVSIYFWLFWKNESEIKSSGQKSQFFKQANFECPKKAILDPLFYNPRLFWWFIFYERPNIWWLKQFLFSKIFKIKSPERSDWTQFEEFVYRFSMGYISWWYSTKCVFYLNTDLKRLPCDEYHIITNCS